MVEELTSWPGFVMLYRLSYAKKLEIVTNPKALSRVFGLCNFGLFDKTS